MSSFRTTVDPQRSAGLIPAPAGSGGPAPGAARGFAFSWHRLIQGTLLLLLALGAVSDARAQENGSVSGIVISTWEGTPLSSVAVSVRGTTLATQTDAAGKYQLNNVPPGNQVLRFSKSGFESAVVTDVRVIAGQSTTVNGNLRPEFYELEEYEVTAEDFNEQTVEILKQQQGSASMIEALGSEFLSRVGAVNAAESIAKVPGVTIVEGKSAVIRGLNDRYVTTTLNGAKIPSADPYRQAASLDLFPAQVIDHVVVAKTSTPDQPGTFTGGGIDIVTKSFPEKAFLSFSLGGAYNTQATFNDHFLTYRGGGLDWAGLDDGTRALPDALEGQKPPPALVTSGSRTSPNFNNNVNSQLQLDALTRALGPTQFAPTREAPPIDHNFSLAGGGSVPLFGGTLGLFTGVGYKHDYAFYENGIYRRYGGVTAGVPDLLSDYHDARSLSIVNWSGMVNLAYKPWENHELGFTFFYNQNATDEAGIQDNGFENYSAGVFRKFRLHYTERNLNTYQVKGEHLFPSVDNIKFNWLVALTGTTQDEPDARFFNDIDQGGGPSTGGNTVPTPSDPTRYFRSLEENNRNVKLDWTVPFRDWTDDEGKFKFGLFDSHSKREFTDHALSYPGGGLYGGDPNTFLTEANEGLNHIQTNLNSLSFIWDRYIQSFDSRYHGQLDVQAGYLMAEVPLVDKLKLVGGARYETTDLQVHSESYLASSVTSLRTNDTPLNRADLLPSAGLIYSVTPKMNVRVNYGRTIARPSFREVAAYYSYDTIIRDFVEGNPLLKMSSIDNYDARWEWFPRPGEVISVSFFYKDLQDAIERGSLKTDSTVISFANRPTAKLYGLELEARKNLDFLGSALNPFSIGGNLTLVQSEVKLTPNELAAKRRFFPSVSDTRPLYDQSHYVVNLDLSYDNRNSGTTAALVGNVAGPRIAITKLNADDVYEQPAPALDFVISQKIGRHATLKFSAKNLLDPTIKRTYGKHSSFIYSSYRKGRTFGLSLNCEF
jgi:outer membrane receptor protein involved in Fe transport